MAKRRKVGNLLALAVLTVVVRRPTHPYEMASVLRARGKDRDMAIKWGSLYTVVQNLEKHGLLETAGSARQGGRPERTVYQITDAGREELRDWTRELLSTPEREHPRFEAGLSVMAGLPPDEVIALPRERLERLEGRSARGAGARARRGPASVPRRVGVRPGRRGGRGRLDQVAARRAGHRRLPRPGAVARLPRDGPRPPGRGGHRRAGRRDHRTAAPSSPLSRKPPPRNPLKGSFLTRETH